MSDSEKKKLPPLVNPKEMLPALPLPLDQPEVLPLPFEALPDSIANFIKDVSKRQQCPPDYLAMAALCGLSAVIGNKIKVFPKHNDDWAFVPNLWGALIGLPASSKSPSMKAALAPLQAMEKAAWQVYEQELADFDAALKLANIEDKEAQLKAKALTKKGNREGALRLLMEVEKPPEPSRQRIIVNDTTVEMLGVLMNENPTGLLLNRDELAGWLSKLNKEDGEADRAFYLECYDGNGSYTVDRIGRGSFNIESTTLAVIGGIQPARLAPIIRGATRGSDDDGLIQRLQLMVWPDISPNFKWHDLAPHKEFARTYADCFHRLAALPKEGKRAYFDDDAQPLFIEWVESIQKESRGGDLHPVMSAHLLKMQKTVASIGLIFELIETGETAISEKSLGMALGFYEYLRSHAERVYAIVGNSAIKNAKLILHRRDKLKSPFKPAEIQQKGWSGLADKQDVHDALMVLYEHNQIKREVIANTGGRPSIRFHWNSELN